MPEPLSYASLGVRRVINAAATLTALGGSVMPDEVMDAMRMAASSHIDMHELQAAVGAELARLTHNEAAYVSAGAAAWRCRSWHARRRAIPPPSARCRAVTVCQPKW